MTWRHTLAALAGALLLAACAQTAPTPTASPGGTALGPIGGTLRAGMDLAGYESYQVDDEGTYNHAWDPQTTWAQEPFELFRCCLLRTLMSYNGLSTSEGGAELRPDLAADYPVISADGLTWTFKLKPDLHYAPPLATTQIVAGDFVRALERTLRPDPLAVADARQPFGPYAHYLGEVIVGATEFSDGTVSSISGLEAPDDATLVIHLLRPTGDLGARLALPAAAPIPVGAADGHDAGYGRYLVASGPYMIEGSDSLDPGLPADQQPTVSGYVPGASLTLVRNPQWSRATDSLRAALADRIEISQFADYDQELAAVLANNLDLGFATNLDQSDVERLRADSALAARVHVTPALASDWITLNLAVPPFDDVHVRRALNWLIDKRALVDLLDPAARVQTHAIPDAFENGLLVDYDPYATPEQSGNLERAKSEMALSAYDTNGDGACDATVCQQIYVPVRNDDATYWTAAQSFAGQLAPLGITLDLESLEHGPAFGYVSNPENHSAIGFTLGWGSDYLNGSAWFGPLAASQGIGSESGANLSLLGATAERLRGWSYQVTDIPSLDAEIESCVALTGAAQFDCWARADQYVMERVVPWVPLDNRQSSRVTSASVTRFAFDAALSMPSLDRIAVVPEP